MNCYRVTKYNPKFRADGKYTADDWTSVSDIGGVFSGQVLTRQKYEQTERRYIDFVETALRLSGINELKIVRLEKYNDGLEWRDGQKIDLTQIASFMQDCLREKCWAKLEADDFYVHFGYDYYMYVGTALSEQTVEQTGSKIGLFVEKFESPYCAK